MTDAEWLADRFEEHRSHLRAVAYRMLGSLSQADDAVQETWLRLSRAGTDGVANLRGWLTTVVGRICLDMLRSRKLRGEEPLGPHLPDPIVHRRDGHNPEQQAALADSVGLALLVVLEALPPPERLAFILHDMFAMPFTDIAPIIGCSPAAARQHASRARRRVKGVTPVADVDLDRQREIVDAFLAAARGGDFDRLLAVLDPDVVLRVDRGVAPAGAVWVSREVRGAGAVAELCMNFGRVATKVEPVVVNGAAGIIAKLAGGRGGSVAGFTIRRGRIVEIDVLSDPARLQQLGLIGGDRSVDQ